jgi:integrase
MVQLDGVVSMASIGNDANGYRRILFVSPDGSRKTVRLGKCSKKDAETVKFRIESLLSATITGSLDRDTSFWLASITEKNPELRSKLEAVGLVEPLVPEPVDTTTLSEHVTDFIRRVGATRKPGTIAVWRQVESELTKFMPEGILLSDVTRGHAKQFHESLKKRGLATLTIVKHVRIAKQMLEDAVEWEKITANPFAKIKLSASIPKHNVEVPRETIDSLMPTLDTNWQTIIALSRYGGLRCPSEVLSLRWADIDWERSRMAVPEPKVEHHEGRGVRSCPIFPELLPYLQKAWDVLGDEPAEFVIDMPAYRAAANTGEGWKNANLRTQLLKRLKRAGISPWGRLFHSMRASRQTELERSFPLHVVCHWLGNSPKVANRSYLLTTESDFERAVQGGTDSGTVDPKNGTKSGTVRNRTEPQEEEENLKKTRENAIFAGVSVEKSTDGEGFEPPVGKPYSGFQDRCIKPLCHPSSSCFRFLTTSDLEYQRYLSDNTECLASESISSPGNQVKP